MGSASGHPFGAQNFQVVSVFLENLCTVIIITLSAPLCWETFTYPRLSVGLGSVRGRKFILCHKVKWHVLGICVLYDTYVIVLLFAPPQIF